MRRYQIIPIRSVTVPVITTTSLPTANQGAAYSTVIAVSGGRSPFAFSVTGGLDPGLTLDPVTGVLSGTPTSSGTEVLLFSVTDQNSKTAVKTLSLVINASTSVTITTTSPLPAATQGVAYSTTMAATGGTLPYTWTIASQTGSNAWSISTSGVLTATPSALETDVLVIKVSDHLGAFASGNFNLTVNSSAVGLVPNITALSAAFPSADPTGYDALAIGSKPSGFSWQDTVTGVWTTKITANGTPGPGCYMPHYAQMGLGISLPWGPNLDQYHIVFCNNAITGGDGWICDYGLKGSATPGPYNFRALPTALVTYGSGICAFTRRAGNQHLLYILVGGAHLRLYNVATGAFVDSSAASLGYSPSWPATGWPWTTSFNQWLMLNAAETWASGNNSATSQSQAYALNIGSTVAATPVGTALTWVAAVDDTYVGYGDFVYTDQNGPNIWDLKNSTVTLNAFIPVSPSFGGNANFNGDATSHMAVMRFGWIATSTINSAAGPMPAGTVQAITGTNNVIGTTTTLPSNPKYQGSYHTSGNFWQQADGPGQYFVQSNLHQTQDPGSQPASENYAISFVNVWANVLYRLGFAYSDDEVTFLGPKNGFNFCPLSTAMGSNNNAVYWSQPHFHISHDGKLGTFGSNMRGAARTSFTRIDLFVMEAPLTAGTPASFP
jgi:hypothetical protein